MGKVFFKFKDTLRLFCFCIISSIIHCFVAVWQSSPASLEHCPVPFLPVNPDLSAMRNQGRQKLARFSPNEFAALVMDILHDCKRRQSPSFGIT